MLENKRDSRTAISSLGEFKLIDHLTDQIVIQNKGTIKGVGDDCAVIENKSNEILITTDLLIEGVHFDLSYMPLKHLGYKAVMVNLSDIYAMNGRANQITVSIALSKRFTLEAVEELYSGIHLACKNYNVDLIGGDTTSSTKGMLISITAIGEVGMDYKNVLDKELQKKVFTEIIKLSKKIKNPLIIHSRQAEEDVINLLEENKAEKVIMHCFNGKKSLLYP